MWPFRKKKVWDKDSLREFMAEYDPDFLERKFRPGNRVLIPQGLKPGEFHGLMEQIWFGK